MVLPTDSVLLLFDDDRERAASSSVRCAGVILRFACCHMITNTAPSTETRVAVNQRLSAGHHVVALVAAAAAALADGDRSALHQW